MSKASPPDRATSAVGGGAGLIETTSNANLDWAAPMNVQSKRTRTIVSAMKEFFIFFLSYETLWSRKEFRLF
jgi:hypothetical protein